MERNGSVDIGRGLAILSVYLQHSILYHPINMAATYAWCGVLTHFLSSFNMQMFFIISGYLFSMTRKSTTVLYKEKTMRLAVPYLFTMAIVIAAKLLLPSALSYNPTGSEGFLAMITNTLVYGGDRWFVYTLYILFAMLIPFRKYLKNKWTALAVIAVCMVIYLLQIMPNVLLLNKVFYYITFFLAGMCLNEYGAKIKDFSLKYRWAIYVVVILTNMVFFRQLSYIMLCATFFLPFIGTLGTMTLSFQLEKESQKSRVVKYVNYIGKYSLQFYLLTFCFPIIRTVIVSVMHITNPFIIVSSVFILQLVTATVLVEITRRIKWLKIPCGY